MLATEHTYIYWIASQLLLLAIIPTTLEFMSVMLPSAFLNCTFTAIALLTNTSRRKIGSMHILSMVKKKGRGRKGREGKW